MSLWVRKVLRWNSTNLQHKRWPWKSLTWRRWCILHHPHHPLHWWPACGRGHQRRCRTWCHAWWADRSWATGHCPPPWTVRTPEWPWPEARWFSRSSVHEQTGCPQLKDTRQGRVITLVQKISDNSHFVKIIFYFSSLCIIDSIISRITIINFNIAITIMITIFIIIINIIMTIIIVIDIIIITTNITLLTFVNLRFNKIMTPKSTKYYPKICSNSE